jgi:hypothetical protein
MSPQSNAILQHQFQTSFYEDSETAPIRKAALLSLKLEHVCELTSRLNVRNVTGPDPGMAVRMIWFH